MLSTTTNAQIEQEWQRKADASGWADPHTLPTTDIRNNAFRAAFDALARVAVPFLRSEYAYYSDMLWDAETLAQLPDGGETFIMVRGYGTNMFNPSRQGDVDAVRLARKGAIDHCNPRTCDGRAVLRVERRPGDHFLVSVIHEVRSV